MELDQYDYIVIGSGFGGSVSALRLAQKGYKVAIIESGKRLEDKDFAESNWNIFKFLYMPHIFCYGIQRMNLLDDVLILSGAGVGGGSLVYANTLYIPPDSFFEKEIITAMGGKKAFEPFYKLAKKMLGVVQNPRLWKPDETLKQTAAEYDKQDTFSPTPVAIYFGKGRDKKAADPFFEGDGPERNGCNFCGGCMVGCRHNAKNTLRKNYLYLAENLGVTIIPEHKVIKVMPLSPDGKGGYEITARKTTSFIRHPKKKFFTRGVIFSAGALGTQSLLHSMKDQGVLPNISDMLGSYTRTNSEAILGIRARKKDYDYSEGIAITSSVYPDEHTHIEPVRYNKKSGFMGLLATILVDGGGRIPRQLRFLVNIIKHPVDFIRTMKPWGFAKESVILLVMQTLDNSIRVMRKRRWVWPFKKTLSSTHEIGDKVPSYIPLANEFARRYAKNMNAIPGSTINEVLLDVPITAHVLGGCIMGESPETGVIDLENRVYGYSNMYVCDGSMIPANLGVNPSLSITAFTERAMSFIPVKSNSGATFHHFDFEKKWRVTGTINKKQTRAKKARQKKAAAKPAKKSKTRTRTGTSASSRTPRSKTRVKSKQSG